MLAFRILRFPLPLVVTLFGVLPSALLACVADDDSWTAEKHVETIVSWAIAANAEGAERDEARGLLERLSRWEKIIDVEQINDVLELGEPRWKALKEEAEQVGKEISSNLKGARGTVVATPELQELISRQRHKEQIASYAQGKLKRLVKIREEFKLAAVATDQKALPLPTEIKGPAAISRKDILKAAALHRNAMAILSPVYRSARLGQFGGFDPDATREEIHEARSELLRAIEINPYLLDAYFAIAESYGMLGDDFGKAAEFYTMAILLDDQLESALAARAEVFLQMERIAEAERDARRLSELESRMATDLFVKIEKAKTEIGKR